MTASTQGTPTPLTRAQARLPPAKITKIRVFYPPNYDRNGPQAFPQSNMVVLVDTDVVITGIGQSGSPDTVRNVARSVIGKNPFDTEMIWQAAFTDGFYSPGKNGLSRVPGGVHSGHMRDSSFRSLRARPRISAPSLGVRGARMARREERAYRAYVSDEQRRQAGCIGGQDDALILGRALR